MTPFETISFHITKPCNMKCKFCYATFNDMNIRMMTLNEAIVIIEKLKEAGVEKITFAGGEPMLHPHLDTMILHSKNIGLTTSIITNGFLVTPYWLNSMQGILDWIGISIDSLDPITNKQIGRTTRLETKPINYVQLVEEINKRNFKLKINTVVNRYNKRETFLDFINYANPSRWKVFQALRIEEQNDKQFEEIKVTFQEFMEFISRNQHPSMVRESNKLMTGSYLLIDPQGRLFENSKGIHTYSRSLITNSIEDCLKDINLDRDMFIARGGIYNW